MRKLKTVSVAWNLMFSLRPGYFYLGRSSFCFSWCELDLHVDSLPLEGDIGSDLTLSLQRLGLDYKTIFDLMISWCFIWSQAVLVILLKPTAGTGATGGSTSSLTSTSSSDWPRRRSFASSDRLNVREGAHALVCLVALDSTRKTFYIHFVHRN